MVLSQNVLEQSSTYQDIKLKNYREFLLSLGTDYLGKVTPETNEQVEAIEDIKVLEALAKRVSKVKTWNDLLASLPAASTPQN